MDRAEAHATSERLNREHPERTTHHWFARESPPGTWSVARVAVGPLSGATGTAQAGKPSPPPVDDPMSLPGGVTPWTGPV